MKCSEQGSQLLREMGPYFLKKTEGGGRCLIPSALGILASSPEEQLL